MRPEGSKDSQKRGPEDHDKPSIYPQEQQGGPGRVLSRICLREGLSVCGSDVTRFCKKHAAYCENGQSREKETGKVVSREFRQQNHKNRAVTITGEEIEI